MLQQKERKLIDKKRIKFVGAVQHLEDFLYLKTKKMIMKKYQ